MSKKKKVRVQFRKNRGSAPRSPDLAQMLRHADATAEDLPVGERVSGKGSMSRHRTIVAAESDGQLLRDMAGRAAQPGRVVGKRGPYFIVQAEDRTRVECATRGVVRTFARDERTAIVTGDRVLFSPVNEVNGVITQGIIERVEPRQGTLSRQTRRGEHLLVANVDQVLIVVAAADPQLKTNLVDRYLISAGLGGLRPVICINKIDLVESLYLQSVVGIYAQLGYEILLVSVKQNLGLEALRHQLRDRQTVISGQSGVGKSSLLNAVQPGLQLLTGDISEETRKGTHTTSNAELRELEFGGWVVDTPGIRQFELANVEAGQSVAGYFPEFRPYLSLCKFANCSHTHEAGCRVKLAVERDQIALPRYESYLKIVRSEAG